MWIFQAAISVSSASSACHSSSPSFCSSDPGQASTFPKTIMGLTEAWFGLIVSPCSVFTFVTFLTHLIVPLCSREWSHTETADTAMREYKICTSLPPESRWTHGCFNTSGPRAKQWVPLTLPFSSHFCKLETLPNTVNTCSYNKS